jgi:hypothetical protein
MFTWRLLSVGISMTDSSRTSTRRLCPDQDQEVSIFAMLAKGLQVKPVVRRLTCLREKRNIPLNHVSIFVSSVIFRFLGQQQTFRCLWYHSAKIIGAIVLHDLRGRWCNNQRLNCDLNLRRTHTCVVKRRVSG